MIEQETNEGTHIGEKRQLTNAGQHARLIDLIDASFSSCRCNMTTLPKGCTSTDDTAYMVADGGRLICRGILPRDTTDDASVI